jgi:hypothetical protein
MLKKDILFYIFILLIFILALFLVFLRVYYHYSEFQMHRSYLRHPLQIESWMNFKQISNKFGMNESEIINVSGTNITHLNPNMNLDYFCKHYNQNCNQLIQNLNSFVKQ